MNYFSWMNVLRVIYMTLLPDSQYSFSQLLHCCSLQNFSTSTDVDKLIYFFKLFGKTQDIKSRFHPCENFTNKLIPYSQFFFEKSAIRDWNPQLYFNQQLETKSWNLNLNSPFFYLPTGLLLPQTPTGSKIRGFTIVIYYIFTHYHKYNYIPSGLQSYLKTGKLTTVQPISKFSGSSPASTFAKEGRNI